MYVHFREPGQARKRKVHHTGALAWLRSGLLSGHDGPVPIPTISDIATLKEEEVLASAARKIFTFIQFATVTKNFDSQHLTGTDCLRPVQ